MSFVPAHVTIYRFPSVNAGERGALTKSAGFSLIEVMLQLLLLSVIVIPMVMALNSQQNNINANKQNTINNLMADQIFDNVDLRDPDIVDTYKVGTYAVGGGGGGTYLYSVYCDPATKVIPKANYAAQCPKTAAGGGQNAEGPFFKRTITSPQSSANGSKVKVTVKLYKTRENAGLPDPYYETSRDYYLDSYHLNVGTGGVTNYSDLNNPQTNNYGDLTVTDKDGNFWIPEFVEDNGYDHETAIYNIDRSGGCLGGGDYPATTTALEPPYNAYRTMKSSACGNGVAYKFRRIAKNSTYNVKVHFLYPTGASGKGELGGGSECLDDTEKLSCNLADITISAKDDGGIETILATYKNYDIGAAASMGDIASEDKRVVFQTSVKSLSDTNRLYVSIKPTAPDNHTTYVYLAGIEVTRRPD